MSQTTTDPVAATCAAIRESILAEIGDARVEVTGQADHFEISVTSAAFTGKSSLQRQRLVYKAIAHLMQGAEAPVHAVDRLETAVPEAPAEAPAESADTDAAGGGEHRVITLTPEAEAQVRHLIEREGRPGIGLRLGIKGGGCSGLSYHMDFSERRDGDTVIPHDGFEVYLDRKSVIYLSGITLHYQGGLSGRGFVFENPQATNTCGCGESFSL